MTNLSNEACQSKALCSPCHKGRNETQPFQRRSTQLHRLQRANLEKNTLQVLKNRRNAVANCHPLQKYQRQQTSFYYFTRSETSKMTPCVLVLAFMIRDGQKGIGRGRDDVWLIGCWGWVGRFPDMGRRGRVHGRCVPGDGCTERQVLILWVRQRFVDTTILDRS